MVVKLSNGNIVYFWWPGDRKCSLVFQNQCFKQPKLSNVYFFPINIKTEYFEDKILFALEHVL